MCQLPQDVFTVFTHVQTETTSVIMDQITALNHVMVVQLINKIQVSTKWLVEEDMTLVQPKLQPLTHSQTKMVEELTWTSLTFRATLLMISATAKLGTKSITPMDRSIAWPMTSKPLELVYLVTGKQKSIAKTATFMEPLLVHTINHKTKLLFWWFEKENI